MFNNVYGNKRVLITGHTGFKGAWLSQWLLNLGADVCGFSSYIPSTPSLFEAIQLSKLMKDLRGDIRDLQKVQAAFDEFKPDIVFHLAAQPIVLTAFDDPKVTFDTNAGGTVNVLEAIRQSSTVEAAVMITSDKCYENVEWEFGYRETDQLGGKDPYSASKACAEIIISSYWRSFLVDSGKKIATGRAGNVIGGGDWADNRIVPDAMRAWSVNQPVNIRQPYATRPWQHVLEPLSGYLLLGEQLLSDRSGIAGESFNFGPSPDNNHSVYQLISAMEAMLGKEGMIAIPGNIVNQGEAGLLKLCCDKALHRMDWRATLDFNQLVKMVATWYQSFYQGDVDMNAYTLDQIHAYEKRASVKQIGWAREAQLA